MIFIPCPLFFFFKEDILLCFLLNTLQPHFTTLNSSLILNLWMGIHLLFFCKVDVIKVSLYKQMIKKVSTLTE